MGDMQCLSAVAPSTYVRYFDVQHGSSDLIETPHFEQHLKWRKEGRKEKLYCKRKLRFKAAASATTTTAALSGSKRELERNFKRLLLCTTSCVGGKRRGSVQCSMYAKSARPWGVHHSPRCIAHSLHVGLKLQRGSVSMDRRCLIGKLWWRMFTSWALDGTSS